MARTRRSQTIEPADESHTLHSEEQVPLETSTSRKSNQRGRRQQTADASDATVQGGRKRTTSSRNASTAANLAAPTSSEDPPTKKARNKGPSRARPLQLKLVSGEIGDMASQQPQSSVPAAAAAETYAFYDAEPDSVRPTHHNSTPTLSEPPTSPSSEEEAGNNSDSKTEHDSDNNQEMIKLARQQPSKFKKTIQFEACFEPSWNRSAASPSTFGPTSDGIHTSGINTNDTSVTSRQHSSVPASASAAKTPEMWPPETELVMSSQNRVNLSAQQPAIQVVLQDAIERVKVSLLFVEAFPEPDAAHEVVKESVTDAAERYLPGTLAIYNRLKGDNEYLSKMCSVPSARIPLMRGKVKDYCTNLVLPFFSAINNPNEIVALVTRQLENYHYIYPTAHNTTNLVIHARPYRNDHIIKTLRELYFSGGRKSFAARIDYKFTTFEERDGTISQEVPVPMLALAATALYASIHEWRLGFHKPTHFTAETYFEAYQGNRDTIRNIENRRKGAFHRMMSDVFSLASYISPTNTIPSGVSAAVMDLDALEE